MNHKIFGVFTMALLCIGCVALAPRGGGSPKPAHIMLDGEFNDWSEITPAVVDPADAAESPVDFGEVRVTHDERLVHFLVDFGRSVNVQGLDGQAMILLDVDGDAKTGKTECGMPGVDVIVDLTPFAEDQQKDARRGGANGQDSDVNQNRKREAGHGLGLRSTTYDPPIDPANGKPVALNPYDIGFAFAPTYAAKRFEFRIERGTKLQQTPTLFEGGQFSMKLVFVDLEGKVADETDVVTLSLTKAPGTSAANEIKVESVFSKRTESSLRVMTWNVERGAIFAHSEPFRHIIAAINPDVVLLEEIPARNTAEDVRQFLDATLPLQEDQHWNVVYGKAGGDLHCVIAARLTLQPIESLQTIPLIDRPNRDVRAACGLLTIGEHKTLITAVHLKCCGKADGPEDQQRIDETKSINAAIANAASSNQFDSIIIAGDFNLVGTRDPVEIVAAGLDADHSNLTIVPAYQLDGITNATWSDRSEPFSPGRLDYMLFSDSKLILSNRFVFDSQDVGDAMRTKLHVEPDDSERASDHMPIVADFTWKFE